MHDPSTRAFEVKLPFTEKKNKQGGVLNYGITLFSIWHIDPETDGSDDSCGWFMRERHGKKDVYEKIKKSFKYEIETLCRDENTTTYSFALTLFQRAAYIYFGDDWDKAKKWMRKNFYDLFYFSNNPTDSIINALIRATYSEREIEYFSSIIYGYILRETRPWWKHPKWHIHHWQIQVPLVTKLKRFLFSRCEKCGGRFSWNESPISNSWNSTGPLWFRSQKGVYHSKCSPSQVRETKDPS